MKFSLGKVKNWIDERTPLIKMFSEFLHEEIPGGTRFSYTLGSACLFLLIVQIVTGIWQLFYYVPTVDYAYSSLSYLRLQVPFGWLIHGLHYWGGTLFTIVVGLHVLRVFIWASYKKPREMVWLMGVVLLILTAMFMFTGPVLPWDKKGYWAGQVGLGIAGSVPIVGPFTQQLLQGGAQMGQMALLRIYVLHVAIIPIITALFVTLHLLAFRQYGEAGPWDQKKRKTVGHFWPEQLFKDVLVSLLLFILMVGLTAYFPPDFTGLADPMDTLYTPKPEWNFLFLYELLKYFPGPFEPIGTAGIPTLIILILVSLPFADRSPERNPFKRAFVMSCGAVFVFLVLFFTWLGYKSGPDQSEKVAISTPTPKDKNNFPVSIIKAQHAPWTIDSSKPIAEANKAKDISGEKLFKNLGCAECHTVNGKGGKQGPDLLITKKNNRSKEWLRAQIVWPQQHNLHTIMPAYSNLDEKKVDTLIDYLNQLTPPKEVAVPVSTPVTDKKEKSIESESSSAEQRGEQLYNTHGCTQCHTITGRASGKTGPDLIVSMNKNKRAKDWLKTQLLNPNAHNPMTTMPSYANRMQDAEINDLVDFIFSLSKRKPAPLPPGAEEPREDEQADAKKGASEAVFIIGNARHGGVLFHQSCIMCHGPQGKIDAPGFKPVKGVPGLNPIDPNIFHSDADKFVRHIDQFIQKGIPNSQGGPDMPAFGQTHGLTQAQIADIESYVLLLNGVDRAKVINPGVEPEEFFLILMEATLVIVLLAGIYWLVMKYVEI